MWEYYIAHELGVHKHEISNLPTDEFDGWIKYFKQKNEQEKKEMKKAQQKARKPHRR